MPSYTFSQCRLSYVFGWDLEKFWQKGVTSYTFFRSACYLKFWIGLRKVSTKMCAQLHIFSLWRLTWVFDGTWNNFHKKVCPVICFFAVETNLSFWWDLEKFLQKSVPSHTFLRCGEYLKFLRGLGKFRQKGVTSYTFFRSAFYLKFWIKLRKVSTKLCAQIHVFAGHAILSFG